MAIVKAIRNGNLPASVTSMEPRPGWVPGAPLDAAEQNTVTDALNYRQEQARKRKEEASGIPEEGGAPKAKRPHAVVEPQYKNFWFEHLDFVQARYGWGKARAWRTLRGLAPEVYGGVHEDTYKQWKRQPAPSGEAGRQRRLSDAFLSHLVELTQEITRRLPLGTCALGEIFKEEAKRAAQPAHTFSKTWLHNFLKQCKLSYKRSAPSSAKDKSTEEHTEATRH